VVPIVTAELAWVDRLMNATGVGRDARSIKTQGAVLTERFVIYEPYGHGNVFTTEIYSRKEEWSVGEL